MSSHCARKVGSDSIYLAGKLSFNFINLGAQPQWEVPA
jgi:hypothetical protein